MINFVPTPQDENTRLQTSVTKTATFKSAGVQVGPPSEPGGVGEPYAIVVNITAADYTTGDETYKFKLQESVDDVDGDYADVGIEVTAPVSGGAIVLGTLLPVPKGFLNKPWVRLVATLSGTTPSVTYEAWLNGNVLP